MLYAGLDVHKRFVQACFKDQEGKITREEVYFTTAEGMQKLLRATSGVACVLEASTSAVPVYDALIEAGVHVTVAHPLKVKAIASARLKTDKVDARMLADLLRGNLIPEAHFPGKETRELKQLVLTQCELTESITKAKNRLQAYLLQNGVRCPRKPYSPRGRLWLEKNAEAYAFQTKRFLDEIDFLETEKDKFKARIKTEAQKNPDAVLLQTIPGVGWFSALAITTIVDGVKRFPDSEHLASYAGLVPTVHQSSNRLRIGHLTKQGSPLLRWVLVEDAWNAVRGCEYFKKVYERHAREHAPAAAIIPVARKLLRVMYFMLVSKKAFDERLLNGSDGRRDVPGITLAL